MVNEMVVGFGSRWALSYHGPLCGAGTVAMESLVCPGGASSNRVQCGCEVKVLPSVCQLTPCEALMYAVRG